MQINLSFSHKSYVVYDNDSHMEWLNTPDVSYLYTP